MHIISHHWNADERFKLKRSSTGVDTDPDKVTQACGRQQRADVYITGGVRHDAHFGERVRHQHTDGGGAQAPHVWISPHWLLQRRFVVYSSCVVLCQWSLLCDFDLFVDMADGLQLLRYKPKQVCFFFWKFLLLFAMIFNSVGLNHNKKAYIPHHDWFDAAADPKFK